MTRLNDTWCDRHWQPYREGQGNGIFAAVRIMEHLVNLPEFGELVDHKMRAYRWSRADAANSALVDLVRKHGRPLCCILGDEVMTKMLADSRAPTQ